MKLDEILSKAGKNKRRRRVGRGNGSGHGKTSGRGHRGYHSRSGSGALLGFEGGQNPALARIPKRGFSNFEFRKEYQVVNVASLERFADSDRIDPAKLAEAKLVNDATKPVKVLGSGRLTKKLTVVASKFSATATRKIEAVGGAAEEL